MEVTKKYISYMFKLIIKQVFRLTFLQSGVLIFLICELFVVLTIHTRFVTCLEPKEKANFTSH